MRLRRLTVSGIGPFRGEETVDFDALTQSGLFLIEGPTGAGKSTIIDAIVYALYGSVTGGRDSRNQRMRSDLADAGVPSRVELEFDIHGATYRITRQPAYERPKLRGSGTVTENARQTLEALDGSFAPLTDAVEIGTQVQRLLGLKAEHFRKLVVLPQGECDALLKASPGERFDILGSLIDDGFMEQVQADLVERSRSAVRQRDEARATVHDIAAALCARAAEALPDVPGADDLTTSAVGVVVEQVTVAVAEAERELAATEAPTTAAVQASVAAEAALDAARQAASARDALARALESLPEEWRGAPPATLRQHLADSAARCERLVPLAEWEATSTSRARHEESLRAAVTEATSRAQDLQRQIEELPDRRRDLDRRHEEALLAASSLAQHEADVSRLEGAERLMAQIREIDDDLAAARAHEAGCAEALMAAQSTALSAREHRVTLLERRLAQSAAALAETLGDGAPCPVCGSADHPALAEQPDDGLVTEVEVDRAETALREATSAEQLALAECTKATARLGDINQQRAHLQGQLGPVDVTDLATRLASARIACAHARQASLDVVELARARTELDGIASLLGTDRDAALAAMASAEAALAAFLSAESAQRQRVADQVGDDTTAAAALAQVRTTIGAIEVALDGHERVGGQPMDVDVEALIAAAKQALVEREIAEGRREAAQRTVATLAATRDAVAGLVERWEAAHAAVASVLAETEAAIRLGDLVSARSAANLRRLTLQAYAVQHRFRSVLEAATVHLERMSGGHFALELDESSSGNAHTGLGICVRDLWSDTVRDTKALSGGESFIASLALALGLADIVREENGGVDLDTLFVDEGFGSLDQESLQQVLDQLDSLRSRGRVVGVISHVTEMKDWVHDWLRVVPGAPGTGSRIVQSA